MTVSRTYLDYNASAPLRPEARAAVLAALDLTGNASSVHAEGRRARAVIEAAREQVAALVKARPSEVVFTSGATEANNWALSAGWSAVFASPMEHDSVLAPLRRSGARHIVIPAMPDGIAAVESIAERVLLDAEPLGRALVVLQMANNETGVLQRVADTAAFAREHGLAMHCDAVQAIGRVDIDFPALGIDTMALSSHKIGGPKGIGALVVRDGLDIAPLIVGGGQERRRRAGTEAVAAIAGFGAAAQAAGRDIPEAGRIGSLRDALEEQLLRLTPDAVILGRSADRLANTSCIALPGRLAETLVIALDLAGIAVSAGAACASGKVGASPVIEAMGLGSDVARSAIRVSIGADTGETDIAAFLAAWGRIAAAAAQAA